MATRRGLGYRILKRIQQEIQGAQLTPNEHYVHKKHPAVCEGVYIKALYGKGDALTWRRPKHEGCMVLDMELQVQKPKKEGKKGAKRKGKKKKTPAKTKQ
jgi:hypothetical protein